jgi:hypothetical protein
MTLPEAEPGLEFRYVFIWRREYRQGLISGKERPACVAVATDADIDPQIVVVLPIAHSEPKDETVGIEIPSEIRRALGLEDEPCWVIVTEFNIDEWPPPGIAPLPRRRREFSYGVLPGRLFERIKHEFLKHYDTRRAVRR